MRKNLFFLSMILYASLLVTSCGGDGVDCSDEAEIARQFEAATNDYFQVFLSFSTNPTTENCEAVREATETYIDFGDSIRDCVPSADRAEYDRDLAEARQALDDIDCG